MVLDNVNRLFASLLAGVPVGGSPTGAGGPSPRRSGFGHAGGSPAPPIFKTGSRIFADGNSWTSLGELGSDARLWNINGPRLEVEVSRAVIMAGRPSGKDGCRE